MRRLPLFPLPMVLLPGARLPLHIFEPRYRQMVAHCVESDNRFGLVYHDADELGPFSFEERQVGCVAEILEFRPLPDGRSLVMTRGLERFQIDDGIESPSMYYEGLVDEYIDVETSPGDLSARRQLSVALFTQVVDRIVEEPESIAIDTGSETSFQLAQYIRINPRWQQELLVSRNEGERLERLDRLLSIILDSESLS